MHGKLLMHFGILPSRCINCCINSTHISWIVKPRRLSLLRARTFILSPYGRRWYPWRHRQYFHEGNPQDDGHLLIKRQTEAGHGVTYLNMVIKTENELYRYTIREFAHVVRKYYVRASQVCHASHFIYSNLRQLRDWVESSTVVSNQDYFVLMSTIHS